MKIPKELISVLRAKQRSMYNDKYEEAVTKKKAAELESCLQAFIRQKGISNKIAKALADIKQGQSLCDSGRKTLTDYALRQDYRSTRVGWNIGDRLVVEDEQKFISLGGKLPSVEPRFDAETVLSMLGAASTEEEFNTILRLNGINWSSLSEGKK